MLENKRKNSSRLRFVIFLFLLIRVTLIVPLYSIVCDTLFISKHITLTLQNNFGKRYKNSKTKSLLTVCS